MRKLFRNNLAIIIIKMSSRSLAAARSRRAGENAPPVSGNRPITSTGSAAAFSNMNQPSNNVRVSRQQQPSQQQFQQQQPQQFQQQQPPRQQSTSFQQVKQSQQQAQSSQPFSKLSISDAVGLITLRLGRIEQWVIESEHNDEPSNNSNSNSTNLPDNSKIIDNSVFLSIIDRLDTIEKDKTSATPGTSESVAKLTEEFTKISEQLNKVCDESNKQILTISKHTEQLFRFERELVETKDILKTFMLKYDSFVAESNERFSDYEVAMTELEKSIQIESAPLAVVEGTTINDIDVTETYNVGEDLKNMVEQELSSSSSSTM